MNLQKLVAFYQTVNSAAAVQVQGQYVVIGNPKACPVPKVLMDIPGHALNGVTLITPDEFTIMALMQHADDARIDAASCISALQGDIYHPLYWLYLLRVCTKEGVLVYPDELERLAERLKPVHIKYGFDDPTGRSKLQGETLLAHAADSVDVAALQALYQSMNFIPAQAPAPKGDQQLLCEALIGVTSAWLKASKVRSREVERDARQGVMTLLGNQAEAGVPGAKMLFQEVKDAQRTHGVKLVDVKTPKTNTKAAEARIVRHEETRSGMSRFNLHAETPAASAAEHADRPHSPQEKQNGSSATDTTGLVTGEEKTSKGGGCCVIL